VKAKLISKMDASDFVHLAYVVYGGSCMWAVASRELIKRSKTEDIAPILNGMEESVFTKQEASTKALIENLDSAFAGQKLIKIQPYMLSTKGRVVIVRGLVPVA
jgi:hypothetical protein